MKTQQCTVAVPASTWFYDLLPGNILYGLPFNRLPEPFALAVALALINFKEWMLPMTWLPELAAKAGLTMEKEWKTAMQAKSAEFLIRHTKLNTTLSDQQNIVPLLTRDLAKFRDKYGEEPFGVAEIDTAKLAARVMLNAKTAPFKSFDAYHAHYAKVKGLLALPETDRWPVLLTAEPDKLIEDGWARFHCYYAQGAKTIPCCMPIEVFDLSMPATYNPEMN